MSIKEANGIKFASLNGVTLADAEVKTLKEEARLIKATRLWTIIDGTLEADAKQRMFKQSKSWEDMFFGKAMLYNKDIERKIVDTLSDF